MTLYAKITRDLEDTGERQQFDEAPPGPEVITFPKPYWVPVVRETVDNSTQQYVNRTRETIVAADQVTERLTITDKTQAEIDAAQEADAQSSFEQKIIKALAIWCAQGFGVPLSTARDEIKDLYKSLIYIQNVVFRINNLKFHMH